MSVIYSQSTQKFLQELTLMLKITHHENDKHLKTPKQLKGIRRLYENNTSKFEPIVENREHLIKTLLPMVVKLASSIANKYGGRIEYDDCISAGNQGAVIATDIYIRKSKEGEQPAKLSTYAHSYITKYINEYCYSVNSPLSHGPTKWVHAAKEHVISGNQTYSEDGRTVEFFDFANDSHLMTAQMHSTIGDANSASELLFAKLTCQQKHIVFLAFGIDSITNTCLSAKQISRQLNISTQEVNRELQLSLELMRQSINSESIHDLVDILRSTDLSTSIHWQRTN